MVSYFVVGEGCGTGGSRPHTVRCAAKNRPTAPSATALSKSVLDSDSHAFSLTECHGGQTTILSQQPDTTRAATTRLRKILTHRSCAGKKIFPIQARSRARSRAASAQQPASSSRT